MHSRHRGHPGGVQSNRDGDIVRRWKTPRPDPGPMPCILREMVGDERLELPHQNRNALKLRNPQSRGLATMYQHHAPAVCGPQERCRKENSLKDG